ncbi:uncharacterized protein LOC106025653 isoform X2 [Cavia porcellus]|uniref:uncharacterized protein LOC106025653 isoform X2 n=1 Tax=Cavia porcellus TaxID=10141 RepID=UPI002FE3BA03
MHACGLGEGASNATAFIFHTERGGAAGGFRKTPPSEMSSLGSRFFSAPAKNTQEPGGVTWRHWRDRKPLTHRAAGGSAGHGPSDRTQRPGLPGLQRRGHRGGTAQLGTGTRGLCRCLQLPHSRRPQEEEGVPEPEQAKRQHNTWAIWQQLFEPGVDGETGETRQRAESAAQEGIPNDNRRRRCPDTGRLRVSHRAVPSPGLLLTATFP